MSWPMLSLLCIYCVAAPCIRSEFHKNTSKLNITVIFQMFTEIYSIPQRPFEIIYRV